MCILYHIIHFLSFENKKKLIYFLLLYFNDTSDLEVLIDKIREEIETIKFIEECEQ